MKLCLNILPRKTFVMLMMTIFLFTFQPMYAFNDHDTLRIYGDSQFPPYEYINGKGEPDGFNVDLLKAIMVKMGMNYIITLDKWEHVLDKLENNKVDMIAGMLYTDDRKTKFNLSNPILHIYPSIIHRKGENYNSIKSLKGKKVVVLMETGIYKILQAEGCAENAIESRHLFIEIEQVSRGRYDAVIMSSEIARYVMNRTNIINLDVTDVGFPPIEYKAASKNKKIMEKYNEALLDLKKSGEYDSIYHKWFGRKTTNTGVSEYFYIALGVLVLVVVMLIVFNVVLGKKVRKVSAELMKRNSRLTLAMRAGKLCVWGYNIKEKKLYNIHGNCLPEKGANFEVLYDYVKTDHGDNAKAFLTNLKNGLVPDNAVTLCIKNRHTMVWEWIECEFIVSRNENGSVKNIIGTYKNITTRIAEQKHNEDLTRKYQTAFDNTIVGLSYFNKRGCIIESNEAATKIFGHRRKYIETEYHSQKTLFDNPYFYEEYKRHGENESWSEYIEYDFDELKRLELYSDSPLQGKHMILLRFAPILNSKGMIEGYIVASSDVTEQEELKKKMEAAHEDLKLVLEAGNLSSWQYDIPNQRLISLQGSSIIGSAVRINTLQFMIHPDDRNAFKDMLDDILLRNSDNGHTVIRINAGDGYRYYDIQIVARRDRGVITHIFGTEKDITDEQNEHELLKESKLKLELAIKDGDITQWDYIPATSVLYVNNGESVSELNWEDEITNLEITDSVNCDMGLDMVERIRNKEISKFNISCSFLRKKTLERAHMIVNGVALTNEKGEIVSYTGLCRNVTTLIEMQKKLETEKEKAERADRLKSAFLANMSHEIRTPLNSIVGFSELLQRTDDPEEKREYIEIININNELLLQLISDILDLSKIESGFIELRKDRFDMSKFFDELSVSLSSGYVKSPEVKFIADNPYKSCIVYLDKSRTAQIYTNFITNAAKYTSKGHIKMGYECVDNGLRLYVEDTGVGIPKPKQELAFQRFEKLGSFEQGSGLGLSICKAIMDAKKGTIGVDSEVGKGSTFWVWVPCDIIHTELAPK